MEINEKLLPFLHVFLSRDNGSEGKQNWKYLNQSHFKKKNGDKLLCKIKDCARN